MKLICKKRCLVKINSMLSQGKELLFVFIVLLFSNISLQAQQFNTDNYWTAPKGTQTTTLTTGQEFSLLMATAALLPKLEVNLGATLFDSRNDLQTSSYYSTTAYLKYTAYENSAKTGGVAIMAGTGVVPGYFQKGTLLPDSKSYWFTVPVTFPFFENTISWDIMPGMTYNKLEGLNVDTDYKSGFTYSSRVAFYKIIPQSSVVAEVFGTEGEAYSAPQYKVGVRWESKNVIVALTYGDCFEDVYGAGFEIGVMILSPEFLCFDGCRK